MAKIFQTGKNGLAQDRKKMAKKATIYKTFVFDNESLHPLLVEKKSCMKEQSQFFFSEKSPRLETRNFWNR